MHVSSRVFNITPNTHSGAISHNVWGKWCSSHSAVHAKLFHSPSALWCGINQDLWSERNWLWSHQWRFSNPQPCSPQPGILVRWATCKMQFAWGGHFTPHTMEVFRLLSQRGGKPVDQRFYSLTFDAQTHLWPISSHHQTHGASPWSKTMMMISITQTITKANEEHVNPTSYPASTCIFFRVFQTRAEWREKKEKRIRYTHFRQIYIF